MAENKYYPVQIPFVLDKEFSENIKYTETLRGEDFAICFWEMTPRKQTRKQIKNVIVTDGCIDLVADYENKRVGFAGFSKTNFADKMNLPHQSMGVRFKPGAFFALTNISAEKAMDNFLPLAQYDKNFDADFFFSLSFDKAKIFFKNYVRALCQNKKTDAYLQLFDKYCDEVPDSAIEFYETLNYSSRQCQRIFAKHFGLTPQKVLCILRFQKCLRLLTSANSTPGEVLDIANYYDQAHFIKDFKRHIGLTPFEFLAKYK